MTPQQQWEHALRRLDEHERSNVMWRYARRRDAYGVPFADLPPIEQARWIDYARKRAQTYPAG